MITLAVGYDKGNSNNDTTLCKNIQICTEENLKLNKDKCYFRCNHNPLFSKNISKQGVNSDPNKL